MKSLRIFTLAACMLSLFAAAENSLRIISFNAALVCIGPNCLFAEKWKPQERSVEIGTWLKSLNADLVFLQEVFSQDHLHRLQQASNLAYSVRAPSNTGLAIISKYPLQDSEFSPFSWQASTYLDCRNSVFYLHRGVQSASLNHPQLGTILLANTHILPRRLQQTGFFDREDILTPARKLSSLELLRNLQEKSASKARLIVAGDFNMNQDSEDLAFFDRYSRLQNTLQSKTQEKWKHTCTFCGDNPKVIEDKYPDEKALDHVYVRAEEWTLANAFVAKSEVDLSDHRAVVVDLVANKQEPPPYSHTIPPQEELKELQHYFKHQPIHWLCALSSAGHSRQRKLANDSLESFINEHHHTSKK